MVWHNFLIGAYLSQYDDLWPFTTIVAKNEIQKETDVRIVRSGTGDRIVCKESCCTCGLVVLKHRFEGHGSKRVQTWVHQKPGKKQQIGFLNVSGYLFVAFPTKVCKCLQHPLTFNNSSTSCNPSRGSFFPIRKQVICTFLQLARWSISGTERTCWMRCWEGHSCGNLMESLTIFVYLCAFLACNLYISIWPEFIHLPIAFMKWS